MNTKTDLKTLVVYVIQEKPKRDTRPTFRYNSIFENMEYDCLTPTTDYENEMYLKYIKERSECQRGKRRLISSPCMPSR